MLIVILFPVIDNFHFCTWHISLITCICTFFSHLPIASVTVGSGADRARVPSKAECSHSLLCYWQPDSECGIHDWGSLSFGHAPETDSGDTCISGPRAEDMGRRYHWRVRSLVWQLLYTVATEEFVVWCVSCFGTWLLLGRSSFRSCSMWHPVVGSVVPNNWKDWSSVICRSKQSSTWIAWTCRWRNRSPTECHIPEDPTFSNSALKMWNFCRTWLLCLL
jgi:hypothetical protein